MEPTLEGVYQRIGQLEGRIMAVHADLFRVANAIAGIQPASRDEFMTALIADEDDTATRPEQSEAGE